MGHIRPVRINKLVMKTTHREIVEKFVYKDMQAALRQICSAFVSDKHNAIYGAADFVDAALAVASKNGYVGAVLKNLRGDDKEANTDIPHWVEDGSESPSVPKYARVSPTPQWFLGRLDGHSGDELSEMGADMLDASLQAVRSMGAATGKGHAGSGRARPALPRPHGRGCHAAEQAKGRNLKDGIVPDHACGKRCAPDHLGIPVHYRRFCRRDSAPHDTPHPAHWNQD